MKKLITLQLIHYNTVGNIGIGIANAIGFNNRRLGKIYPKPIAGWSAEGKTNEDEDRDVLKDLTGNGHDIILYNVAFSEMSGYGGYSTNFKKWVYDSNGMLVERTSEKVVIKYTELTSVRPHNFRYGEFTAASFKLISNKNCAFSISVTYNDNSNKVTNVDIIKGEPTTINLEDLSSNENVKQRWCWFSTNGDYSEDLTIELLPEYPGALVLDGVYVFSIIVYNVDICIIDIIVNI